MKALTEDQLIRALRRLERQWPPGFEIFVGDGTLSLFRSPIKFKEFGAVDSSASIADFPGIPADGGGY